METPSYSPMNKLLPLVIILAIAAGGFYWYTQSGIVLTEPAPSLPSEEIVKEMPMPDAEQKKIDDMVNKANDPTMTSEEKMTMEKEAVTMMNTVPVEMKVSTPMPAAEMKKDGISRQGSFTEIDLVHKASGLALIYPETATGPTLRLQDFSATRGPDLYVYLSKNTNITSSDQLGEFYSLGQLKSSKGNQNYALPANHQDYKSVVIWCQAFGVLFSSATLKP